MKNRLIILAIFIFNSILVFTSIQSGIKKGDISLRFQERQTVTFFSALFLGFTGLTSLFIYALKNKKEQNNKKKLFWFISGLGFFFLCIDEYFMAHEGLDKILFSFTKFNELFILDSITLILFGLVAFLTCAVYFSEIIKERELFFYFILGGTCFFLMVVSDFIFNFKFLTYKFMIVIEESFKILGASFFMAGYIKTFFNYLKRFT